MEEKKEKKTFNNFQFFGVKRRTSGYTVTLFSARSIFCLSRRFFGQKNIPKKLILLTFLFRTGTEGQIESADRLKTRALKIPPSYESFKINKVGKGTPEVWKGDQVRRGDPLMLGKGIPPQVRVGKVR